MASAILAGVNPVFGLYNLMVGSPIAALFTSSV
jgi:MFS superfamily sulfate permease-like transporter